MEVGFLLRIHGVSNRDDAIGDLKVFLKNILDPYFMDGETGQTYELVSHYVIPDAAKVEIRANIMWDE